MMVEEEEEKAIVSEAQIFNRSGPLHLTSVDWRNLNHQRTVAASLVQGVYVLDSDRQEKRQPSRSCASPWWESFHFRLTRMLIDDVDNSIFGAIYALKPSAPNLSYSAQNAPQYVVAFRGTVWKQATVERDLEHIFLCIINKLRDKSRYQQAKEAVQEKVSVVGAHNVWLAGHSLGSTIALLVGKTMTRMGYPLRTFLFNPPFPSIKSMFKNQKLKDGIHEMGYLFRHCVSKFTKKNLKDVCPLTSWKPYLFVNPFDKMCSGYIEYFERREKMEEIQISMRGLLFGASGEDLEPFYLIPSANLIVNLGEFEDFKSSHGIHQWWNRNDSKFRWSEHSQPS